MATVAPWSLAEAAAREAYGRLVAILTKRSGDLASAEDALADALLAALERWPAEGIPANPRGWLLTVARRRAIDQARRRASAAAAQAELSRMQEEAEASMREMRPYPDERLGLMLACAHPAIDAAARTPLMLQAILGISAESMASAFLTSPAAMTKRLVRAKAKLIGAGVRFEIPGPEELVERLAWVLDAVYAAFTIAHAAGGDRRLQEEALWLGRLLAGLAPDQPEAAGLLALMLFVSARGRVEEDAFVPLSRSDPRGWDEMRLREAEATLRETGRGARPGRFQVEAAIQAVHVNRRRSGRTDWGAILMLYDGLLALAPTIGAEIARAAALAQSGDPCAALQVLNGLDSGRVAAHQPYWATRAFVLAQIGCAGAADSYLRAAGLAEPPALRVWLLSQRAALAQ